VSNCNIILAGRPSVRVSVGHITAIECRARHGVVHPRDLVVEVGADCLVELGGSRAPSLNLVCPARCLASNGNTFAGIVHHESFISVICFPVGRQSNCDSSHLSYVPDVDDQLLNFVVLSFVIGRCKCDLGSCCWFELCCDRCVPSSMQIGVKNLGVEMVALVLRFPWGGLLGVSPVEALPRDLAVVDEQVEHPGREVGRALLDDDAVVACDEEAPVAGPRHHEVALPELAVVLSVVLAGNGLRLSVAPF